MPDQPSQATMTYSWPNSDPAYWQALVEYVFEADHEAAPPETFGDFIRDYLLWLEESTGEVHRVKVLTPDENELLGNALYMVLDLNEDAASGDVGNEDYEEEVEYNETMRELVEREWPIDAGAGDQPGE